MCHTFACSPVWVKRTPLAVANGPSATQVGTRVSLLRARRKSAHEHVQLRHRADDFCAPREDHPWIMPSWPGSQLPVLVSGSHEAARSGAPSPACTDEDSSLAQGSDADGLSRAIIAGIDTARRVS